MNRLSGKTVLITGASAGIGEACAHAFAAAGCRLVLTARREDRIAALARSLEKSHGTSTLTHPLDVRNRAAVTSFVERIHREGWGPDLLLNNAGLSRGLDPIHEGNVDGWEEMIDTNVKGLLFMTRAVLPHMVERNDGHILNLGSSAGHIVYPKGNVYNATKFAVRALTEGINLDLVGTRIRVSSIDPGLVETEFSQVRFWGDEERAERVYQGYTPLSAADVADLVLYVANAPAHVNILQTVIYPTDQRNPYVLHREDPAS